jgi:glycerol-3-phosphate dehydrogenase
LLRPATASRLAPIVASSLRACGIVEEALTNDARLTLATARAAGLSGAVVLNYVRAVSIDRSRKGAIEVALEDSLRGEGLVARCRAVVNAAGPWVDHVRRLEEPNAESLIRLSKGVHAVLPLEGDWRAGVALFDDSRSAVAIPWHGLLLLGATDVPYEGKPEEVTPSSGDVATLLGWFSDVLPTEHCRPDRVVNAFAGLRVLPKGRQTTTRASRRHSIAVGPMGVVSVAGGKFTSHRTIALDALRHLPAEVRPRRSRPSDGLPGSDPQAASELLDRVEPETALHLLSLYGSEATQVLAYAESVPNALERIHPSGPDVWAQAHFAVDREWAMTVDDLTSRRTTLAVRGLATERIRAELAALLQDRLAAPEPLLASASLRWSARGRPRASLQF